MRHFRSIFALLLLTAALAVYGATQSKPDVDLPLSDRQLSWIASKIFQNECNAEVECLVHWNQGEDFPSLGIGHFKWYPRDVDEPYAESFPALVKFMKSKSVGMPEWLAELDPVDAPWPDREAFLAHNKQPQVEFLRWFLDDTRHIQAQFMYERAQATLEDILDATPEEQRPSMRRDIEALRSTPAGIYALIDYVNFKGEGLSPKETYKGEGWGLRQVLERMGRIEQGAALKRFREAATDVLIRRANNADRPIEKQKFLAGWLNRVDTYRQMG